MDSKMCLKFLFFLCSSGLQLSVVNAVFIYYGNNATERTTSGLDPFIPSEPRIWIDDPLNCESCPRWGYLQFYHVYIHASSSSSSTPLPRLFLQIWSNTTMFNNYTLKWQKVLDNYQRGKLYKVAPDAGQVVEVNEMDRIGFTSEGNGSAIALDLEPDDPTASKAHRTYFRSLFRDNYALPVVGDYRYVDNNALRGRYSIGIELDNAPPRKSTEVYLGHDLIRRSHPDPSRVTVDESVALVSGRVTAFYFRLGQLTTATSMQLYIWQKTNTDSYILTYFGYVTIAAGPEQTRNVSLPDGPLVDSSHRFGWYFPTGLFYSDSSSGNCRFSVSPPGSSNTVGQTYEFDGLSWNFDMSIGVIVDQQASTASTSTMSSSSTTTSASTTTSRSTTTSTTASTSTSRSTSTSSMPRSTSLGPPTPGPPTSSSGGSYSFSSPSSSSSSSSSSHFLSAVSSNNNGISTTPLKPAEGRKSDSPAIHPHRMSIFSLIVTLHLLIACISS